MIKIGGIGGLIWLVGIILGTVGVLVLNLAVMATGGIIAGVGILLLGLAGIGFWQIDKTALSILTGIFGIIGGILLLAGGAVLFAGIEVVLGVGGVLTGIFLILFGLILLREQARLDTSAQLGIDLALPTALTTFIAGCAQFGIATGGLAAPGALLIAIVLLLAK
ncbi:MAG: hypothetical protein QMD00_03765 [Hadesarchaea archaeon]|nr:hypothetical protein [Hadesarchaea archaeon]